MVDSSLLKDARKLFSQNKYEEAITRLDEYLEDEPKELKALVLKAAAQQRLNQNKEAIATFKIALGLSPDDINIWKGLSRTYFQDGDAASYFDTMVEVLYLLGQNSSSENIQTEVNDYFSKGVRFLNRRSTPEHIQEKLLELQIPPLEGGDEKHAEVYELIKSSSAFNREALEELVTLRQKALNKDLARIRARQKQSIHYSVSQANSDQLKQINSSKIVELLKLQTATEDKNEVRRPAEAALLELLVKKLEIVNSKSETESLRNEIKDRVEGMIMFDPATPLAYELAWDWEPPSMDAELHAEEKTTKEDLTKSKGTIVKNERSETDQASVEVTPMRKFMQAFPVDALAKVLNAYFSQRMSVTEKANVYKSYKGNSVLGWALIANFFVVHEMYEAAIDSVHSGLKAAETRSEVFGMDMVHSVVHFKLILATSYSHYHAHKNAKLAMKLYDEVLATDPHELDALVGKGLLLMQSEKLNEASKLLEHVLRADPHNSLALSELSWLRVRQGRFDEGIDGLKQSLNLGLQPSYSAELKWRIGYAVWTAGKKEESFDWFMDSLKDSPNFAPSYTYLGLFYEARKDKVRAQRCYYKALQLDNGQVLAGERLSREFANDGQWDLVEVVASTVLASDKMKIQHAIDWPYRVMGIVSLNQNQSDDAVKFFQKALRIKNNDVQSWIGLGEAYIGGGRYRSAEKALNRALKLDPTNFSALYVLSLAQRETIDFQGSARSLEMSLKHAPSSSTALLWAIADNALRAAYHFITQSLLGNAHNELERASDALVEGVETESKGVMWGGAAELAFCLSSLGFSVTTDSKLGNKLLGNLRRLASLANTDAESILQLSVAFARKYVAASEGKARSLRVAARSIAGQACFKIGDIDGAIEFYRDAIALESKNADLWNGYGIILERVDPIVAQHCFVRSLSLDGRNAEVWVNLAGLYLTMSDTGLAIEAAERALSLEPEHARAWVTQALADIVQKARSDDHIYRTLEYAYSLSGNDELVNLSLGLKAYEVGTPLTSINLGALDRLLAVNPRSRGAQLVMGLLLERKGDYEGALSHLTKLSEWCHVARIHLALGNYEDALNAVAQVENADAPEMLLSQLLTAGIAHFFLNQFDDAIEALTEALGVSENATEDVLKVLVSVLWESGSADARQVALDQLYGSIEDNGATLQTTLLLGVLGILNKDDSVMEAAEEELRSLITPEVTGHELVQAVTILAHLERSKRSIQRAIFQLPTECALWRSVDTQQALIIAEGESTDLQQLSHALIEAGGFSNCQRAAFYAPSEDSTWYALSKSLTGQKLN